MTSPDWLVGNLLTWLRGQIVAGKTIVAKRIRRPPREPESDFIVRRPILSETSQLPVGAVGPRLDRSEMKRCHWVKPVMVCQVKFTEWTRDDRLRQSVFLGIREDKNASEVIREKAS
jgi:hypothetical protein